MDAAVAPQRDASAPGGPSPRSVILPTSGRSIRTHSARSPTELRWYRWDAHEPVMGWQLQLAVEDPEESVAWAILARDAT